MKSNLYELPNIIQWGIDHGVDRIKGHHVWKTSDSLNNELLRTPENAAEWNKVCAECHSIASGKIKLENFIPVDTNTPMQKNGTILNLIFFAFQ